MPRNPKPKPDEVYPPRALSRLLHRHKYDLPLAERDLKRALCQRLHKGHGWNCGNRFDDECHAPEDYKCSLTRKAKAYARKGLKNHELAVREQLRRTPSGKLFPRKWMLRDTGVNMTLRRYPHVVTILNHLWHKSNLEYEECRELAQRKGLTMKTGKIPVLALAPRGKDTGTSDRTVLCYLHALERVGAVRSTGRKEAPRGRSIYVVGTWSFDPKGRAQRHPILTSRMAGELAELNPFFGQKSNKSTLV